MKVLFITMLFVLLNLSGGSKEPDFISPLQLPISLNGNFGEIRSAHFHAGIDIKTNGRTGFPVSAIEEGYVSRITVSSTGYGNALYIDHPSGYTSVYGHLEEFAPSIQSWVKEHQYEQQRFEVNLEPDPDLFRVRKGEQIGISGNSGNSGGPHLHLEIRKTNNQHPVNPLLTGFDINDKVKPVVEDLFVYPLSDDSRIRNSDKKQIFNLVLQNGAYHLKENVEIPVWGNIGFGVEAHDCFDGNWSKCGIYKLELWVDSTLINSFSINELCYEKMKQINSHIDYEEYILTKKLVQKTYIEPGNHLDIYKNQINRGIFNFNDGEKHKVRISIFDAHNNKSDILFSIRSTQPTTLPVKNYTASFRYDRRNKFENDEVELIIPEETLYTDFKFNYKQLPRFPGIYSNIYQLHNTTVPLNNNVKIKIKANLLPEKLRDKAIICRINPTDRSMVSLGGDYSFGWVETESPTLGSMCIATDTIAPRIVPLSFSDKHTLLDSKQIRFKITDNLTGIKKYNGYIDNKWVLFEYDSKSNVICYKFDEHIDKGKKHQLSIIVEDNKANSKEYKTNFYY